MDCINRQRIHSRNSVTVSGVTFVCAAIVSVADSFGWCRFSAIKELFITETLLSPDVHVVGSATIATAQSSGTFTRTGNMTTARSFHSATLLPNGQVLIAGGDSISAGSGTLASAELYDPDTGKFRAAGTMTTPRRLHTATLLPDDKVLIVGGYREGGRALASAELFDPVSGTFSATGNLSTARGGHTAILLPTGEVLVIGGYGTNTYPDVAPAELYDPVSRTFRAAGAYVGRDGCDFCPPAVLLADGTVLFPGQYPAQIYDPTSDSFTPSGMVIGDQSAAAALTNGKVLFAGGADLGRSSSAEFADPRGMRLPRPGIWRGGGSGPRPTGSLIALSSPQVVKRIAARETGAVLPGLSPARSFTILRPAHLSRPAV